MAEQLWAPWRLSYIQKADAEAAKGGCIFVDLPAQDSDRENLILFRGQHAFVMLNAFPYTSGHLMVAPYRHTADLNDLNDEELLEINQLVRDCTNWIKSVYKPDGFNIGVNLGRAAGAGIPNHVHWHIVPRWNGDTNFMTTVGEVRVLPQSLSESWEQLRAVVNE
ncbi:MAG TPA: HIT domain-containing protein [Fimbriimonadaceae bacterium]|nr:HIT domain-containing protein [Fimbriimonadaceae bacterium]